jgi:uncharacterized membrane protein YedE/YeeE
MSSFPWMQWGLALAGGLLIGTASALLLWLDGRIAGITGLVAAALRPPQADPDPTIAQPERTVSWSFIAGLLAGGAALAWQVPQVFGASQTSLPLAAVAGLLVGFGTRLGNGCTSGHGVCGLSRRSPRSLAAVMTFMGAGMLTTWVVRHLLAA